MTVADDPGEPPAVVGLPPDVQEIEGAAVCDAIDFVAEAMTPLVDRGGARNDDSVLTAIA